MEKLHSQLPQPLKRCSPSRHGDLLTQIKNGNSPASSRSPARRTVTSSPNGVRSRDVGVAAKQPEVKARSPPEVLGRSRDGTTTPTRRPKYCPAANGNMSPVAKGKISRQQQQQQQAVEAEISETKQSPSKTLAARLPAKTATAQLRTLRSETCGEDRYDKDEGDDTASPWTQNNQPGSSATVSGSITKSVSPKWERRGDFRKAEPPENDEAKSSGGGGGGGSPIYHELDPPGTCRFTAVVQHTYQSIVEISDELASLKLAAAARPEASATSGAEAEEDPGGRRLSRARSAQELTPKSPTKLSLFSRFRFGAKKSSSSTTAAKGSGKGEQRRPGRPEVNGQRSLQDVDLMSRSRDEVVAASSAHDRQPSFSTFAMQRGPPPPPHVAAAAPHVAAARDGVDDDGYSCVYVPRGSPERLVAPVPPRTSSLPSTAAMTPEPLYRKKFLKIASVHTLQGGSDGGLTASNSVGDLLLATTDVGQRSPRRRATSFDDHAVATTGSRRKAADFRSQIARFGLSPGRCAASFSSPSCGVRMAEMRGAVRRCTTDAATSPTRSPSASTPVPSPAGVPVFQFSVPPPGVMMSPPVQRAFRHVSSQTVMSVRPPSATCVLSVTHIHGPAAQMQTIEEEDDDSAGEDLQSTSASGTSSDRQPHHDARTRRSGTQRAVAVASDDVGEAADKVAAGENGCTTTDGGSERRASSEATATTPKTSRLRRPSPSMAAKPLSGESASPLPDPHPSRIVPPSQRRSESSSVSPPSTPRSVDSLGRSGLVRRPVARGPQQPQQRKQVAPPTDADATTTTAAPPVGDGLSVPGGRRACARRLLAPNDGSSSTAGSPNLSSDSSLSLLSVGSDVDGLAGSPAPEPAAVDAAAPSPSRAAPDTTRPAQQKHSPTSVASRVARFGELTVPARRDQTNY